jgi:hypothetical protein
MLLFWVCAVFLLLAYEPCAAVKIGETKMFTWSDAKNVTLLSSDMPASAAIDSITGFYKCQSLIMKESGETFVADIMIELKEEYSSELRNKLAISAVGYWLTTGSEERRDPWLLVAQQDHPARRHMRLHWVNPNHVIVPKQPLGQPKPVTPAFGLQLKNCAEFITQRLKNWAPPIEFHKVRLILYLP